MQSRYQPRRRALSEREQRALARAGAHRRTGSHRQPGGYVHRGRLAALVVALGLTAAVGAAAIGLVPQVSPVNPASASAGTPALLQSHLEAIALPEPEPEPVAEEVPPPADSGEGRRIVFDQGDQRVWLIEADGAVASTYLVSGSRFDNLRPGTYAVQSRSRHATAFDYTGTMEYFVRFTTGWSAPIGFHSIPVYNNGQPEQTVEQLGTPLSAGCIRQEMDDAKRLWDFAPVGTKVVVTA